MGIVLSSIVFGSSFLLLIMIWKVLRATWWEPRVLRKWFEKQGVPCKPYRFLIGDLFEMGKMEDQVPTLPPLDPHAHDQLGPRILPHFYHFKNVYGKSLLLFRVIFLFFFHFFAVLQDLILICHQKKIMFPFIFLQFPKKPHRNICKYCINASHPLIISYDFHTWKGIIG